MSKLLNELKKIGFKKFLGLTAAGIINAIGITMFLAPVNLYDSGISGTSILLSGITPLSLSFFLIVLNVPLFLYGMKKQGITFTVSAIYAVMIYSLSAWLITDVLPVDVSFVSPQARTCSSARSSADLFRESAADLPFASAVQWTALK